MYLVLPNRKTSEWVNLKSYILNYLFRYKETHYVINWQSRANYLNSAHIKNAVIRCEILTSSLECVPVRGPSSWGSVLRRGSAAPSSLTPGTLDSHSFLTPSVHLERIHKSLNSIIFHRECIPTLC